MAIEFEIKLALPRYLKNRTIESAISAVEGVTLGCWSEHMQENTYFDSSDGAVRQARIALRHRRVDGRHVVTVKTAAPGGARHEWESDFDGADIPRALKSLDISIPLPPVEDIISGKTALVPIARTDYLRRCCEARYRGCTVEIAIDRGVLRRGDIRRSFTELELELVSGSEEDVRQLAELVRTRLGLRYELRGKLSRAMNLRKRK